MNYANTLLWGKIEKLKFQNNEIPCKETLSKGKPRVSKASKHKWMTGKILPHPSPAKDYPCHIHNTINDKAWSAKKTGAP